MHDIERASKNDIYHLFKIFIRPNLNDIGLWELYEIVCDEMENRQDELKENNCPKDDYRLINIPRIQRTI